MITCSIPAALSPTTYSQPGSRRLLRATLLMIAVIFVSGCASGRPYNPRDPLQTYNRAVFAFNDRVDDYVVKPVAQGYKFVVPSLVRTGVSNFFGNLDDLWIGANNLLQGKVGAGLGDWMRFVINSTFGLAGVLDVASEAQLPKNNEDLGQTLGWWGVGSGPYVVLPFLGSSTLRDALALPVDYVANGVPRSNFARYVSPNSTVGITTGAWALNLVNTRSNLLEGSNLLAQAATDRYAFSRDAFLQRRRNLVYDGSPPKLKDDDEDARAPVELMPIDIPVLAFWSTLDVGLAEGSRVDENVIENIIGHVIGNDGGLTSPPDTVEEKP